MAVITVGPSGDFTTVGAAVAAAAAGDTIDVAAGTYTNDFPEGITKDLTLQGVGGMVNMVATEAPPNEKAILDVGGAGVSVTINDFSFSGVAVSAADGSNGAGIRYEGGDLTLNDDYFHDNQEGLLAADDPNGSITIDHTEFADNGDGSGFTHNLYVNHIGTLTVENSYFTGAVVGHEIKSRAATTIVENNRIQDGPTGTASYDIDLPNGGNATITGNVIEKGPDASNPIVITYGEEGSLYAGVSLTVADNTILDDQNSPDAVAVVNDTTSVAVIPGNSVYGLTDGEIAHGPADVSGTTFLATEPTLDISAPFAECFVEGTRILTQRGERAVESLLPGDGIVTASGEILPVRWVGMQTLSGQFAARHRLLPVRVRAGALGAGQPWRDLLLSPGHALLLDDLLVQAGALANSDSIVAGADVPATFRYFHVELPRHAVLFAEGAAAESYRAGLELLPFDNAADRPPADEGDELPNPRVRAARQVPPTICARLARWAVPPGPVAVRSRPGREQSLSR